VTVTRRRRVAAGPDAIWDLVADPYSLPRWWPRTERVESVSARGWTTVLRSPRGRAVRADWSLEASERPRRRAWSQELEGTPFERVLAERRVEVRVERGEVTLELTQRGRGWARFGGLLLRRAARRELDDALDGLARVLGWVGTG
jgi:uncharacterized protein YndB with AHSA1/START domain